MPPKLTPTSKNQLKTKLINSGLNFLKFRPRSIKELTNFLSRKTSNQRLVHQVIGHIKDLGLVNDQEFATWLANSRLKKNKGTTYIKLELKKFGISSEIITATLASLSNNTKIQSALGYLNKNHSKLLKTPSHLRIYKARQLLFQRGFDPQTTTRAIDESGLGE